MTLNILNVVYVLIAAAMIGFILVQRGAGAQAGSGFGAGASATVFGARGAGNFLTKSTAVLATLFFVLSLVMGILISRGSGKQTAAELGVMSEHPAATEQAPKQEAQPAAQPAGDVPAAPAGEPQPKPKQDDVPEAPKN
jgi:preprotein translocase subunit SecG